MTSDIQISREVDGRWIAEIPALPGVMAYGCTQDEAVQKALRLADEAYGLEYLID